MSSLNQILRRTIQLRGNHIATCYANRQHTWKELGDRVARLASALQSLGVKAGDRIAILSQNSDRYYEFYFAVSWVGAVFVPINTRLAPPEFAFWLNDSGSSVLFIDDDFLTPIKTISDQLSSVHTTIYLGDKQIPEGLVSYEKLIQSHSPIAASPRGGDDLAGIFYTGGTTGRSKGVMLSHRGLTMNPLQTQPIFQISPEHTFLHTAPMFHIADGLFCMIGATFGTKNVFLPFNPTQVLETIQSEHITHTIMVPTMINMIIHHPDIENFDLSSLQKLGYGGSPMPIAVIQHAMHVMRHVTFLHVYGQTEASPLLTMLDPKYHTVEGPYAGRLTSAGQALPGIDLIIVNPDGNELPRGTVGEIWARGDNVMLGYWQLHEITAETLRDGWLHTGDAGYMDEEGFLFIVDRVKDMIISGGENVFSVDVENAIYQHEAVVECVVIGIPHANWGEQVHAIVRCKDGISVSAEELIAHCHHLIATFKCPRSIDFVTQPLPISGPGKILKRELRKPYWEGHERNVH